MRGLIAVLVIATAVGWSRAHAEPVVGGEPVRGALGWVRFDPPVERPGGGAVLPALRAGLASGVIEGNGTRKAVASALVAQELLAAPFRVSVLGLEIDRESDRIERLQGVLELPGARAEATLRSLRAVVLGLWPEGVQREIDAAGFASAVAFRDPAWDGWLELSWAEADGGMVIGLGAGALERWAEAERGEAELMDEYRDAGASGFAGQAVFLEAFADLDAWRNADPESFVDGRGREVLAACGLSNARGLLVSAGWIDSGGRQPLIGVGGAWSSRAWRPGVVRGAPFTGTVWGDGAGSTANGSHALLIPSRLEQLVRFGGGLAAATEGSRRDRARSELRLKRWLSRNGDALGRVERAIGPWVTVEGGAGVVPVTAVSADLRDNAAGSRVLADVASLLESVGLRVLEDETGGWSAALLPEELDPSGRVRALRWRVQGDKPRRVVVSLGG